MKDQFIEFDLERYMSIWENQVEINLSESGVHAMSMRELVQHPAVLEDILTTELGYPQTNGTVELRERVAALYPGATAGNVLITTGAAQANFTTLLTTMDPGDEAVIMLPNYMQIWGAAKNLGLTVKTFSLRPELNWAFDADELQQQVTDRTRLIAVCSPNNPTGHILSEDEIQTLVEVAERVGAWLLADEVYAGAEHQGDAATPSLWERYDKVLAIGSMSKAYGLPGLRIGWVVAPGALADEIWARQDYVTIGNTMLGNKLAAYALDPQVRPRILARTRDYVRRGYRHFERWCNQHPGLFEWVPPQAAAVAFVHYTQDINSSELVERLIREKGTFVVPGDHFGIDRYLRISYGLPQDIVSQGLDRLYDLLTCF